MLARMVSKRARCAVVSMLFICCSGCSIFVQNRYAVFGFDRMETESAEQARFWSLALLSCTAAGSAGIGAAALWLGSRWRRQWREERTTRRALLPTNADVGTVAGTNVPA